MSAQRPRPARTARTAGARLVRIACAGIATLATTAHATIALGPSFSRTRITAENYDLHWTLLCGVLAIYGVVFGVMLFSVLAHRRAKGQAAAPFHRKATVELVWTVIPWVILFATAWPATAILAGIRDPAHADITIKATGMQWKWGYEYVKGDGEGISFFANLYSPRALAAGTAAAGGGDYRLEVDNPVVVPVNKRIRVVLAANDEIHSWHIPALGVKQYAIPGLVRDTWFLARETGTYRGLCDPEECGAGRACVLIVVKVVSEGDYRKWVAGRKGGVAADAGSRSIPRRSGG